MDASALLLALIGGGTIGAVLTTLLRHSHERDERHRERALQAATDFLAAYERALGAVADVQGRAPVARATGMAMKERTGRFLETSKDLVEAARVLPESEGTGGGPDESPLGSALRALYEVYEVTKVQEVMPRELVAVSDAVSQIEATLPRLSDMPARFGGFGKHLREVLSDIRLALKTGEALGASMVASAEAANALQGQRPMILVLFASEGEGVVQAAVKVVDGLSTATRTALIDAMGVRDGFENAEVKASLASAAEAADEFAYAVNVRLRPSPWWRRGPLRGSLPPGGIAVRPGLRVSRSRWRATETLSPRTPATRRRRGTASTPAACSPSAPARSATRCSPSTTSTRSTRSPARNSAR